MSTILPRLTWAQARARDTARIADIWNIASALQTYYDDNWAYPAWDTTDAECLWSWSTVVSAKLKWYLQNRLVPTDPQASSNSHLCTSGENDWSYWYTPLEKDWLTNNSFIICADVETYQKANTDAWDLTWGDSWPASWSNELKEITETDVDPYDEFSTIVNSLQDNESRLTSDAEANQTVYCILRP